MEIIFRSDELFKVYKMNEHFSNLELRSISNKKATKILFIHCYYINLPTSIQGITICPASNGEWIKLNNRFWRRLISSNEFHHAGDRLFRIEASEKHFFIGAAKVIIENYETYD